MDQTSRAVNGLVYNSPDDPLSPYGFTDSLHKTCHLLFCSVLYLEECRIMAYWCENLEWGEPREYRRRAAQIRGSLDLLWNEEKGIF